MAPRRRPAALQQCAVRDVLARISDRWSLLVLLQLERATQRFSELRRNIGDISQRMLAQTLRRLEEEGLISREVLPSVPPQVRYTLSELGHSLLVPVRTLVAWAEANRARIHGARLAFKERASDA